MGKVGVARALVCSALVAVGVSGCARSPIAGDAGTATGGGETGGTSTDTDRPDTGTTGVTGWTTAPGSGSDTAPGSGSGTAPGSGSDTESPAECDAAEYDQISDVHLLFDVGPMQLEIGPNDHPQVFYSTEAEVWHAVREDGDWITTPFAHDLVRAFGATVDQDGAAHLAYSHGGQLRYHTNASGDWASETTDLGMCEPSSMIVAGDGTVHVAGIEDELLCHGTRSTAGEWSHETMLWAFPRGTSIGLIGSQVHITYYHTGAWHTYDSNGWQSVSVGAGGIDNDMVVGPPATLYMGHSESPVGSVLLSWFDVQGWRTHVLREDSIDWHTTAPRVALDSQARIHLVFPSSGDDGCLQHAVAPDPDGPWTIEDVIPDADSFGWVAVDSQDQVYVAYPRRGPLDPVLATLD